MSDIIYSLSSAPGVAAISVIRISGNNALREIYPYLSISKNKSIGKIKPRYMYKSILLNKSKDFVDDLMFCFFKGPKSYTGEDVIELYLHGSSVVQNLVFEFFQSIGFRYAEPGEFTKRGFLNNKVDLIQAEAINNFIHAKTLVAHKQSSQNMEKKFSKKVNTIKENLFTISSYFEASLDYPEEEMFEIEPDLSKYVDLLKMINNELIELLADSKKGELLNKGIRVAIAGNTNVGKSSIFNLLINEDRAIVSDIHGTTRDYIDGLIKINDIPTTIYDTAGIRKTNDEIEEIGIQRVRKLVSDANVILFVFDYFNEVSDDILNSLKPFENKILFFCNKIDKEKFLNNKTLSNNLNKINNVFSKKEIYYISVKVNPKKSVEIINQSISRFLNIDTSNPIDIPFIQNVREENCLKIVQKKVNYLIDNLSTLTNDIISFELRDCLKEIYSITGENYNEDLFDVIFSNFCLGK